MIPPEMAEAIRKGEASVAWLMSGAHGPNRQPPSSSTPQQQNTQPPAVGHNPASPSAACSAQQQLLQQQMQQHQQQMLSQAPATPTRVPAQSAPSTAACVATTSAQSALRFQQPPPGSQSQHTGSSARWQAGSGSMQAPLSQQYDDPVPRFSTNPDCPVQIQSHWAVMGVAPNYTRYNADDFQPKKKKVVEKKEWTAEAMDEEVALAKLEGRTPKAGCGPRSRGREYVPRDRTAAYAFLITLYIEEGRANRDPSWCMGKEDIMRIAADSGLCDVSSIYPDPSPKNPFNYDGWSSMNSSLVGREPQLVHSFSRMPVKVQLTEAGRALAARLYKLADANGKVSPLPFLDPDHDLEISGWIAPQPKTPKPPKEPRQKKDKGDAPDKPKKPSKRDATAMAAAGAAAAARAATPATPMAGPGQHNSHSHTSLATSTAAAASAIAQGTAAIRSSTHALGAGSSGGTASGSGRYPSGVAAALNAYCAAAGLGHCHQEAAAGYEDDVFEDHNDSLKHKPTVKLERGVKNEQMVKEEGGGWDGARHRLGFDTGNNLLAGFAAVNGETGAAGAERLAETGRPVKGKKRASMYVGTVSVTSMHNIAEARKARVEGREPDSVGRDDGGGAGSAKAKRRKKHTAPSDSGVHEALVEAYVKGEMVTEPRRGEETGKVEGHGNPKVHSMNVGVICSSGSSREADGRLNGGRGADRTEVKREPSVDLRSDDEVYDMRADSLADKEAGGKMSGQGKMAGGFRKRRATKAPNRYDD